MDLNIHRSEIEQFLFDVRDHLKTTLECVDYQNTSNLFNDDASIEKGKLLQRCERILEHVTQCVADNNRNNVQKSFNGFTEAASDFTADSRFATRNGKCHSIIEEEQEEISYLDMTSGSKKAVTSSTDYIDFNDSSNSDKTFRCSTTVEEEGFRPLNGLKSTSEDDADDDDNDVDDEHFNEDPRIYDICNVPLSEPEETLKVMSPNDTASDPNHIVDCPYAGLPAAHLSIQKSSKFGQLTRIEKRLFFGTKKYYCGILNDWLLCYCEGPMSLKPSVSLHLKNNGIEIEHYGEGKRREICFQITTSDPNKKFVFQTNSEVDAKEWIHAIEAAIRGDSISCSSSSLSSVTLTKNSRKLPTPPMPKKATFLMDDVNSNDCIYEEPSPLYSIQSPTQLLISKSSSSNGDPDDNNSDADNELPPNLPDKQKQMLVKKFDYDVPKSPPQPCQMASMESETCELLKETTKTSPTTTPTRTAVAHSQSDFQTKVKDVHSKLSSQLSPTGPTPERLKKAAKKSFSPDSETIALSPHTPQSMKEQKKLKKSLTSPANQKSNSTKTTPTVEKSTRNWFLNRLNKSTSSTRGNSSSVVSPSKCKQSEKENLLNNLEVGDSYEGPDFSNGSCGSSPTTPPGFKGGKVNMIINQFEASGHLATMFSVETLTGGAGGFSSISDSLGASSSSSLKFSAFSENDCNNYEPIMTGPPPSSFMKKV